MQVAMNTTYTLATSRVSAKLYNPLPMSQVSHQRRVCVICTAVVLASPVANACRDPLTEPTRFDQHQFPNGPYEVGDRVRRRHEFCAGQPLPLFGSSQGTSAVAPACLRKRSLARESPRTRGCCPNEEQHVVHSGGRAWQRPISTKWLVSFEYGDATCRWLGEVLSFWLL